MAKYVFAILLIVALVLSFRVHKKKNVALTRADTPAVASIYHEVPGMRMSDGTPVKEVVIGKEVDVQNGSMKDKMIHFFLGSQKALVTKVESRRLKEFMSNRDVIDQAFKSLETNESEFDQGREFERMNDVYFISKAIEWKQNPARWYLLEQARRLILDYKTQPLLPLRLQKSFAADRVDLYKTLLETDPEAAAQIEHESENRDANKIVHFTKGFYS